MIQTHASQLEVTSTPEWPIEEIVGRLSEIRRQSLELRNRLKKPTILPSREVLSRIIEKLALVMFPNRLGNRVLAPECIDYFVGQTLDLTLNELFQQVVIELMFADPHEISDKDARTRAIEIVSEFAAELPDIRSSLDSDLQAAFEGDPAARSLDEILACYPGVFALIHYRIAHSIFERGLTLIARMISELAHSKTGIDIHPGATIGKEFFIDHGTGVVIGETAIIGRRVRLYHGVTLGAKGLEHAEHETTGKGLRRHPKVEDNVIIYANATLLGPIIVGQHAIVGGNVWITEDIPARSTVSQAKIRMDSFSGGGGI